MVLKTKMETVTDVALLGVLTVLPEIYIISGILAKVVIKVFYNLIFCDSFAIL